MEPEDRPTVDEIIENEWFRTAYTEDMPEIIYDEMTQRKLYMLNEINLKAKCES